MPFLVLTFMKDPNIARFLSPSKCATCTRPFFVTLKRMTVPALRSLTGMVSISPYTMAPGKSGRSYCREIHSPHCIWSSQTRPGHSRSCWEVWTMTQCYWWNRTGRLYVFCIKGTGRPGYKSEWRVWSHPNSAFKSTLTITQGKKIFFLLQIKF